MFKHFVHSIGKILPPLNNWLLRFHLGKTPDHFVKSVLTATASDEKLGSLLGMTKKFCFPRKLNITGWLGKSENKAGILYTLRKRLYFAVSKNLLLRYVRQNYFNALRMAQHGLYTSNLLPTLFLKLE